MTLPSYPEYKETNLERIDSIPTHWKMVPCRAIVDECIEKNTGGESQNYLSLMANVGVIRYEDKGDVGNKKPDDLAKCKVVRPGNLVINSMNYGIGSYGLSPYSGVCSPVYIVLNPLKDVVDKRYALRVFEDKQFQTWAQSFGNGILAHRSAIGWDDLKNIKVALPPLFEQRILSRFLDHETTKIDALIHEQERLIELLQEKRQAVISHAVTKGLDPDVPMKDSGVEWLGEVPAHWVVGKSKWYLETTSGGTPPSNNQAEYYDGDIPWLRTMDLNNDDIQNHEISVTQKAITDTSCSVVPKHSVLIAMYGGDGTIGKNGLLQFDSAINQAICAFLPCANIWPKYLHYFTQFYRPYWMIGAESSRKDPNIGQDRIGDHTFVIPPLQEQRDIAAMLSEQLSKFDELMKETSKASNTLAERRSALISAAVTGKIDVRDWQPPADESAYDEEVYQTGMEATV